MFSIDALFNHKSNCGTRTYLIPKPPDKCRCTELQVISDNSAIASLVFKINCTNFLNIFIRTRKPFITFMKRKPFMPFMKRDNHSWNENTIHETRQPFME
ncbi:hypothetical protein CEXT_482961 [Caerostris extrusa]|uniref:Uncharacterized protein n=1 Tax=Caerostris extrusa TaxID=172846 RepID=A0AAV4S581_CAEEX|nr:hypothetical protein CEXT_482961 [Caerostris extrusa]